MNDLTFGYALCGSFCTFSKSLKQMRALAEQGYQLLPVMSYNAAKTDTRFGKASDFLQELREISGRDVIQTIVGAEPIGPKKMVDLMIVAPCTGNTLAKLANGITDTPVTMAVKSNLRIGRRCYWRSLQTTRWRLPHRTSESFSTRRTSILFPLHRTIRRKNRTHWWQILKSCFRRHWRP